MERKRIEKLVVLLLIGILLPVSLFSFPVYADTIDSHIRGRNYTYEPITYNEIQLSSSTYYENIGVFHITFELDDEYIGYVLPNYTLQYDNYFYGAQNPYWGTLSKTFDRRIFINGSSFSFDVTVNWKSSQIDNALGGDPFNYDSYNITSSDVTKYADIDSLDQIINILQDNQDIVTDIYGELQTVVSNTSLANDYLETISNLRQYNFPVESLGFVSYSLNRNSNYVIDAFKFSYYTYPVFKVPNNTNIFTISTYTNIDSYLILICRYINTSNIVNYLEFDNGTIRSIEQLANITYSSDSMNFQCYKITFRANDSGSSNVSIKSLVNDFVYIPISFSVNGRSYYSTDFALLYGFSNSLLDNIRIIANGTSQSSSASASLDQTTSQFSDDANDLVTIEESFNNSMNQSLQSVNPTFNMGSSFLTSANWVSQQFNRIVNNTPFASLITFGLTLGLGLLIIGKVRK